MLRTVCDKNSVCVKTTANREGATPTALRLSGSNPNSNSNSNPHIIDVMKSKIIKDNV